MANKNSHARTKTKRKTLRLKAFHRRTMEKRLQKIRKAHKPKGNPITGPAVKKAIYSPFFFQVRKKHYSTSQQKRRKAIRQNANLYKK